MLSILHKFNHHSCWILLTVTLLGGCKNQEVQSSLYDNADLIPSQSRDEFIKQAEEIVRNLESRLTNMYDCTGYPSREAYMTALKDNQDTLKKYLSMEDNLEFAIRVPSKLRHAIATSGFKNVHQTGTSGGISSSKTRNESEAYQSNIPSKDYQNLPAEIKPKSGYFSPRVGSGLIPATGLDQYGTDVYFLKKENVIRRLTWTAGDSLMRGVGYTTPPTCWNRHFTPWSLRDLMFTQQPNPYNPTLYPPGTGFYSYRSFEGGSGSYNELQIWGPIDLGDISRFEYIDEPLLPEFLEQLKKREIAASKLP